MSNNNALNHSFKIFFTKAKLKFFYIFLLLLLVKLVASLRDIVIAYRFGVSNFVGSYWYILSMIGWPIAIWSNVLLHLITPLVVTSRKKMRAELLVIQGAQLTFSLFFACIACIAFYALSYYYPDFTIGNRQIDSGNKQTLIFSTFFIIFLSIVVAYYSSWANSIDAKRTTLFEAIPAVVISIFLLAPHLEYENGLAWGGVFGLFLHTFALIIFIGFNRELGKPNLAFNKLKTIGSFNSILIIFLCQSVLYSLSFIDNSYLSQFKGFELAAYGYSNKIISPLSAIGMMFVTRSFLPRFVSLASKNILLAVKLARVSAVYILLIMAFIVAAFYIKSEYVVKILFERGRFSESDVLIVSDSLRWGIFQLPFLIAGMSLYNLNVARRKNNFNFLVLLVSLASKFILLIWPIDLEPVLAVQFSNTLMFFTFFSLLFLFSNKTIRGIDYAKSSSGI